MEVVTQLAGFYSAIANDERISCSHISLYMALFHLWMDNHFRNPVSINRDAVMRMAKISGRTTYNKCMGELHKYGYIKYVPSFNFYLGSIAYLNIAVKTD